MDTTTKTTDLHRYDLVAVEQVRKLQVKRDLQRIAWAMWDFGDHASPDLLTRVGWQTWEQMAIDYAHLDSEELASAIMSMV